MRGDKLWKWIIIGNSGVGKTSLLCRLCNDDFNNTFISTIGIDFKIKKMEVRGESVTVQIWDTAGQERFGTITRSCYRGSNGVLLVYDIHDRGSFEDVNRWLNDIRMHTGENTAKILVGNKCDMTATRAVPVEEGQRVADNNGIPFIETSAKTGKNTEQAFTMLAELIFEEQGHPSIRKPAVDVKPSNSVGRAPAVPLTSVASHTNSSSSSNITTSSNGSSNSSGSSIRNNTGLVSSVGNQVSHTAGLTTSSKVQIGSFRSSSTTTTTTTTPTTTSSSSPATSSSSTTTTGGSVRGLTTAAATTITSRSSGDDGVLLEKRTSIAENPSFTLTDDNSVSVLNTKKSGCCSKS